MDDLSALRARLPGYPGYLDHDTRVLADQEVRAFLGESLAAARERLSPSGPVADALEALLLRCEFADQPWIRSADMAAVDEATAAHAVAFDRKLMQIALGVGDAADGAALAGLIGEANTVLDARMTVFG